MNNINIYNNVSKNTFKKTNKVIIKKTKRGGRYKWDISQLKENGKDLINKLPGVIILSLLCYYYYFKENNNHILKDSKPTDKGIHKEIIYNNVSEFVKELEISLKNFDVFSMNCFKKGDIIVCSEDDVFENQKYFSVQKIIKKDKNTILTVQITPTDRQKKERKILLTDQFTYKQTSLPLIIKDKNVYIDLDMNNLDDLGIYFEIVYRPELDNKYKNIQNKLINNFKETGVIFYNSKSKFYINLISELYTEILTFSKKNNKIYHPGSNNQILDIVHPSLYPYVQGLSKLNDIEKIDYNDIELDTDFWNREYEKSDYQMLPCEFEIDKDGKCKIKTYINNLPLNNKKIYKLIEKLFDFTLPEFQKIWSYINNFNLYDNEDFDLYNDNLDYEYKNNFNEDLLNKDLQVICKITNTTLSDSSINGVWHVEGMSHENIVASAVHVIHQDPGINANLYFKRRFTISEGQIIAEASGQDRPFFLNKYLESTSKYKEYNQENNVGLVPLGKVSTSTGSLTVFPNSHIHKLDLSTKLTNQSRMVVVFWLVNPNKKIISTKNVPEQQKDKDWNFKKAISHQLKFMEDRKYYKSKFNVRDLNLCEH